MLKQVSWLTLGRVFAAGIQAITFIMLARSAGPASFGMLTIALGASLVLQALFDLGVSSFIIRERARKPSSRWISRAMRLYGLLNLLLAISCLSIIIVVSLLFDDSYWSLLPLCVWIAAERSSDAWMGILLADGDVHLNTFILVGRRCLALLCFILISSISNSAVLVYALSVSIAALVSLFVTRRIVTERIVFGEEDRMHFRRLVILCRSFWINTLGAQVRNIDSVLVGAIAGSLQAGYYGAAARVVSPLGLIASSMSSVVLPRATKAGKSQLHSLMRHVVLMVAGLTGLYASIAISAPWLVLKLLGESFRSAVPVFQVVVCSLIFSSLSMILTAFLQARGGRHQVARISVASSITFLVLVLASAPIGGALAAAFSLLLAMAVQSLILVIISFRLFRAS